MKFVFGSILAMVVSAAIVIRKRSGQPKPAPLYVDERFHTATAHLSLSVSEGDAQVKSLIEEAKEKGMATLVVEYNIDPLLAEELSRPTSVNPSTKKMRVVYPLTGEDVYPEGVYHSKSVACIVWREKGGKKEVLLVKDKGRKKPEFVAGGMKWMESSADACVREVLEEVGLEVDATSLRWLCTIEEPRRMFGEMNTLTTFAAKAKNPDAEIREQKTEIVAGSARWLPVEDALAELTYDSAKSALKAFDRGQGVPVVKEVDEDYTCWNWNIGEQGEQ